MKKAFLTASAIFSSIPGLLVIATGLGTPPDQKILFGGVIEAFGVITLLILWVNKARLSALPKKRVTKFAIGLTVGCVLCLFAYIALFSHTVVNVEGRGEAYYPIYLTGEIEKTVNDNGSRKAAIVNEGIDEIREEIDKMPGFYLTLTTIILLLVYQLVFTTLTTTFGLLGLHTTGDLD